MHLLDSYDTESYQPPSFTYQAAATLQYSWYNVVMVTAYGTESNLIRDRASHQTSLTVRLCCQSPTKTIRPLGLSV